MSTEANMDLRDSYEEKYGFHEPDSFVFKSRKGLDRTIVEQAREADGCLDIAISADLVDPGRINIYERWSSQQTLDTFRRTGPGSDQGEAMLSVSVEEYDIAEVRPLSGKGKT